MLNKMLKVVLPIAVVMLGLMVWAGVAISNVVTNPIVNTVRGQMAASPSSTTVESWQAIPLIFSYGTLQLRRSNCPLRG